MFSIFEKYPDLLCAFSEKKDGSMKFTKNGRRMNPDAQNIKNRNKFISSLGIQNLFWGKLSHGNNVKIINERLSLNVIDNCDGLITAEKNVFLSVTAADCLPIFLFEPEKEIVGMIHAGWRSLAKNILANAIRKICELGGKPENILAGIGPAICQSHYPVSPEVAEKFPSICIWTSEVQNGKVFLDLKKIAQFQLIDSGLKKENIEISPECTFELPEKYFSARRDKLKEIEAMIAVIGMKR
jgi:YfiH family protein